MTKKRKSKKKKNNQEIIITLLVIVVIVIFGYIIFNKFIIPVWEKYKERPIVTKEIPYEEEEKKEVQPVPAEEMLEVNLYFSDSQGMYLVPEKRKVEKTSNLAKQIIVELIKGPVRSDLYTAIPEGTSVNEVDTEIPTSFVVHFIRREKSFFSTNPDGIAWADPVECLLDLHEMHFESQALEFLNFLQTKGINT